VLVVISCLYSRVTDERDTLSWFLGDGAGAFVVGPEDPGHGILGAHAVPTTETCDTFSYELGTDLAGRPKIFIRASQETGRVLRETAAGYLRACADGALRAAGVALSEIDFFVFNTPTAWFAATCARVLEIDPARTLDTYPAYANLGPALMPVNLHHAAVSGKITRGDLVLAFTVGSVGTASAAVMRWGDVALGPAVPPPETLWP
jgi:3-oxoacyl-[acyl-carrier-protein] synthase-3